MCSNDKQKDELQLETVKRFMINMEIVTQVFYYTADWDWVR